MKKAISYFPLGNVGVDLGRKNISEKFTKGKKIITSSAFDYTMYEYNYDYEINYTPFITNIVTKEDVVLEIERVLSYKNKTDVQVRFNQLKDSIQLVFGSVDVEKNSFKNSKKTYERSIAFFKDVNINFAVIYDKVTEGKDTYYDLWEIRGIPKSLALRNELFKYESDYDDSNLINFDPIVITLSRNTSNEGGYLMSENSSVNSPKNNFVKKFVNYDITKPNIYSYNNNQLSEYIYVKDASTVYYYGPKFKFILNATSQNGLVQKVPNNNKWSYLQYDVKNVVASNVAIKKEERSNILNWVWFSILVGGFVYLVYWLASLI